MQSLDRAAYHAYARQPTFRRRLERAEQLVTEALAQATRPYVAFSTGKDSTVVLDLVWRQDASIPAVYFDAHCAFPESEAVLERLTREGRPLIRWDVGDFLEILAEAGGPTADGVETYTMRKTVEIPARQVAQAYQFDACFRGVRAAESNARRQRFRTYPPLWRDAQGMLLCDPIWDWTTMDVWAYIVTRNLPYNALYDRMRVLGVPEHEQRVSYWAGETYRHHGRWSRLAQLHPQLYRRLGERFPEVLDYGG